jgi:hypothetical protein
MRCSPITISGSNSDVSAFSSRPEIFKANINNGCTTLAGQDVIFPAAGDVVVGKGTAAPEGNCGGSGSSPIVVTPQPEAPVSSPTEPSTTSTTAPTESTTAPTESSTTAPTESSTTAPTATPTQILRPGKGNGRPVNKMPVPVTPGRPDEESVVAKPISPPAGVAPETPGAAPTTPPFEGAIPCDKPGAVVCTGDGSTFALCNHGFLVSMGRTAMGTKCVDGTITRRAYPIRLTGHIRRRHGKF